MVPVYDLLESGPRNRFTIRTSEGPLIVHNCGYGMGKDRFWSSCREDGLFIERALAARAVDAYRRDNPEIPAAWRELESAAIRAVQNAPEKVPALSGKVHFFCDGAYLRMQLPSGRLLSYMRPRLEDDFTPWGSPTWKLYFWGWNGQVNRMEWQSLYGGRIMENLCQAVARDVMLDAMLRLDQAGWKLVLTVHDEILSENPVGGHRLDDMLGLMTYEEPWHAGLPLAAEGWQGHFYRK